MAMERHVSREVAIHQVVTRDGMSCFVVGQAPSFDRRQVAQLAHTELVGILCFYDILILHYIASIEVGDNDSLIDNVFDRYGCILEHALYKSRNRNFRVMLDLLQVILNHLAAIFVCRCQHANLAVEATGTQESGIERFWNIGCANSQNRLGLSATMVEAQDTHNLFKPAGFNGRRVHLQQQFIKSAIAAAHTKHATHAHTAHQGRTAATRAGRADGVELVDEDDAGSVFSGQSARLAIEIFYHQHVHAPEHTTETGSAGIGKWHSCFSTDTLCQVAFAGSWRAGEQQTADGLTAHLSKLFDATQNLYNAFGGLKDIGVALIIVKAGAGFAGHYPVKPRATHKPEDGNELYKHKEDREHELSGSRENRPW